MVRDIIAKFFIVACNFNEKIVRGHYFNKLARDNESNYALFDKFASKCSSTLLCGMHRLGFCDGDVTLENIIRRHVVTRRANRHYESDAGGLITAFLRRPENREGKAL